MIRHGDNRDILAFNANTLLQDKVLFGSDYPLITPDRWLADFDQLEIKSTFGQRSLRTTQFVLSASSRETS